MYIHEDWIFDYARKKSHEYEILSKLKSLREKLQAI